MQKSGIPARLLAVPAAILLATSFVKGGALRFWILAFWVGLYILWVSDRYAVGARGFRVSPFAIVQVPIDK